MSAENLPLSDGFEELIREEQPDIDVPRSLDDLLTRLFRLTQSITADHPASRETPVDRFQILLGEPVMGNYLWEIYNTPHQVLAASLNPEDETLGNCSLVVWKGGESPDQPYRRHFGFCRNENGTAVAEGQEAEQVLFRNLEEILEIANDVQVDRGANVTISHWYV